jgi:rhodanese-related sulfurtransferase
MTRSSPNIPAGKRTTLGLYITAKDAYEAWQSSPEQALILDVRTPEEYLFVGHPAMAWKVPVAVQSYNWDAAKGQYPMRPLVDFVARVQMFARSEDTLYVMCRSGGRSAIAVNLLAEAGYSQAFQVIDGMEGDLITDPDSVFQGQRLKNGWKNSGCPWTYKLAPDRLLLSEEHA